MIIFDAIKCVLIFCGLISMTIFCILGTVFIFLFFLFIVLVLLENLTGADIFGDLADKILDLLDF